MHILLNKVNYDNDENKRKIYVGLTRAKNELYIHYNNDCFDRFNVANVDRLNDNVEYPEPEEIMMQLSHRDIFLDFFKGKKEIIAKLPSGYNLIVDGNALLAQTSTGLKKVLIFSKKYQDKMAELKLKGYIPCKAKIRFVVAWKGENDENESAIILPDVYFKKI